MNQQELERIFEDKIYERECQCCNRQIFLKFDLRNLPNEQLCRGCDAESEAWRENGARSFSSNGNNAAITDWMDVT